MCCRWSVEDHAYYTVNCSHAEPVTTATTSNNYGSDDLYGINYPGQCPYFEACGLSNNGRCQGTDYLFSFIGAVGRVVGLDTSGATPYAYVTFNDGRTAYKIEQQFLVLEYRKKSMSGKRNLNFHEASDRTLQSTMQLNRNMVGGTFQDQSSCSKAERIQCY
jgi:hypothetical protein